MVHQGFWSQKHKIWSMPQRKQDARVSTVSLFSNNSCRWILLPCDIRNAMDTWIVFRLAISSKAAPAEITYRQLENSLCLCCCHYLVVHLRLSSKQQALGCTRQKQTHDSLGIRQLVGVVPAFHLVSEHLWLELVRELEQLSWQKFSLRKSIRS
jgi:hypothetical protein